MPATHYEEGRENWSEGPCRAKADTPSNRKEGR